jgi:1,4-alpha-glucan branching enzyme
MSKTKKDVGAILHTDHVSFRVWAPFAKSVDVTGDFNEWGRTPLQNEKDGYWVAKVKHAKAGQEYKFVIRTSDGKELYKNDPRALHVTTSAGNSVIVDTTFDWEGDNFTPAPVNQQIVYELHIGTFYRVDLSETGTFQSAAEKLDHLADLGITTIEIMPVASMSVDRSWWGYVSDYMYAVESQYGGRHAFLEFVKAAHQRGMAVILDVVYNHLDADQKLDLWQFDGWSQDGKGGIYFYNDARGHTPWGETRLDYGRPEVRQYILDNVRMWLQDCHIDGLRLDATGYMRTVDGHDHANEDIPDAWTLLQEITTLARKLKPQSLLVAEDFSGNDMVTKPVDQGGLGFVAQWGLNIPYVLRCALQIIKDGDHHLGEVSGALSYYYNNDAFERVIFSDSHDSAANGSARLNEQVTPGNPHSLLARRQTLLASAIVLTGPGIPMLFQGQEFMQGGSFSDWQALDWTHTEKSAGILLAHKHLLALRKNQYGNTRGLTGQSFDVLHLNEEAKILAYHRWDQGGAGDDVVVICNFTNKPQKEYVINFPHDGLWRVRFNSDWKGYSPDFKDTNVQEVRVESGAVSVAIAPYSVLILSQD